MGADTSTAFLLFSISSTKPLFGVLSSAQLSISSESHPTCLSHTGHECNTVTTAGPHPGDKDTRLWTGRNLRPVPKLSPLIKEPSAEAKDGHLTKSLRSCKTSCSSSEQKVLSSERSWLLKVPRSRAGRKAEPSAIIQTRSVPLNHTSLLPRVLLTESSLEDQAHPPGNRFCCPHCTPVQASPGLKAQELLLL